MFGHFILSRPEKNTPETRFDNCNEFKQVAQLIGKIRKKQDKLNHDVINQGYKELDYKKYTIITEFLERIDNDIQFFNSNCPSDIHNADIAEKLLLAKKMLYSVESILKTHQKVLLTPRNHNQENAILAAHYGSIGTMIVGTLVTGFGFFAAAAAALGTGHASKAIIAATDNDKAIPESAKLLFVLGHTLINITQCLDSYLKMQRIEAARKLFDATEDTSLEELKSKFKKLALKNHPDKNLNQPSEQKFSDVKEAYTLLVQDHNDNRQQRPNLFSHARTEDEKSQSDPAPEFKFKTSP